MAQLTPPIIPHNSSKGGATPSKLNIQPFVVSFVFLNLFFVSGYFHLEAVFTKVFSRREGISSSYLVQVGQSTTVVAFPYLFGILIANKTSGSNFRLTSLLAHEAKAEFAT
jgi:hypothetical protein